jgi:hypothetical protein
MACAARGEGPNGFSFRERRIRPGFGMLAIAGCIRLPAAALLINSHSRRLSSISVMFRKTGNFRFSINWIVNAQRSSKHCTSHASVMIDAAIRASSAGRIRISDLGRQHSLQRILRRARGRTTQEDARDRIRDDLCGRHRQVWRRCATGRHLVDTRNWEMLLTPAQYLPLATAVELGARVMIARNGTHDAF